MKRSALVVLVKYDALFIDTKNERDDRYDGSCEV